MTYTSNAAVQVDNLRDEYGRGADGTGEAPFKVGDRVRTKGYEGTQWDGVGVVAGEYDGFCILATINGREGGFAPHELAPAILQIEAGKCYRTRDGRKVGPMVQWDDIWWGVKEDDEGRLWSGRGKRFHGYNPHDDLIAEWVDEPQPAATTDASNDNATEPAQPKFKVGDRVRGKPGGHDLVSHWEDYWEHEGAYDGAFYVIGYARGFVVYSANPNGDDGPVIAEQSLELVSRAPSPTTGFTIPIFDDDSVELTALGRAYLSGWRDGQQALAA